METLERPKIETFEGVGILDDRARFLIGRKWNYSSQSGEDGLIAACLAEFGSRNQWCFEVGAHDGAHLSNTLYLRNAGWNAVLIEGEAEHFAKLQKYASDKVRTVPKRIDRLSLDRILAEHRAPRDIDVGVIDVDGQDYHIFEWLNDFRPRILLVEFDYQSEDKEEFVPEIDGTGQATFAAIWRLGLDKGYVGLARTMCNILFCPAEVLEGGG